MSTATLPLQDTNDYEVVEFDAATQLYRRDGIRYKGLRTAERARRTMTRAGIRAKVLPYRDITERQDMRLEVAL